MPSGKRDRQWLRPISELKGGDTLPALPTHQAPQAPALPTPQAPQVPKAPALPTSQAPQVPQVVHASSAVDGGNVDFLSVVINTLNTNPYFIGMVMLLLNLGGRFLSMELSKKQEEFLQQRWLRPFIFFTVIFVATRNLATAFWMTLALFLVLWILANEKSPFCIIPGWRESNVNTQQYEKNMQVIQTIESSSAA